MYTIITIQIVVIKLRWAIWCPKLLKLLGLNVPGLACEAACGLREAEDLEKRQDEEPGLSDTTRQRILDLVSQKPRTVSALSDVLSVTRSAVVVQLRLLIADRLVQHGALQRTGGAGKPGIVYEIVPGTEDAASKAYRPLLEQVISVLSYRMPANALVEILEEAGRRLAQEAGLAGEGDAAKRLIRAVETVNGLGACAEIVDAGDGQFVVENRRCAFASAVRRDACVCHAAAAFFREATGLPFEQHCDREKTLTCRYVALKSAA